MKFSHATAGVAFAALLVVGVTAVAADNENVALQSGDRAQAAMVQKGKALYADHCSHCHGFNMVSAGNVTYDLRTFPHNEKDRFLESVVNGKNNLMPPWGDVLSLDEINDIWAYVLTGGKG